MSLALFGGIVFAVGETTTVPSGIPTEAPGEPVKLTVPEGTLTVDGCASPSAFVTIFEDDTPIGTVVANNFGRFTKVIGNQDYGLHTIQAFQEDKYNNVSTTAEYSTSLNAHEDNFLNDVFLSSTVYHDKDPVVLGDYLTFRGFTCPNATVNLNINNNLILVAKANDSGNWWIVADTSLYALGTHTYSVIAEQNGVTSYESEQYIFRTARRYPGDTGNFFPGELTVPQILEPKDRYISGGKEITVSGIGPANTQIEIYANGRLVGSAFSNPIGEWSISISLFDEQISLTARACSEGVCTGESESVVTFYRGGTEACQQLIQLGDFRFWGLRRNDGLNLPIDILSGQPTYELTVDWGDATIEHITLYREDDTSYHHVYKDIGQFNGSLSIEDARGCTETHYFSIGVTKDLRRIPWVQVSIIALLISAVVALVHYAHTVQEERDFLTSTIGRIRSRGESDPGDTDQDQ